MIAALPFHCVAADPGQAHIPEGPGHDVITALSKHRRFRVLSRAMTATCSGDPDPVACLRKTFDVDYVVEGNARLGGDG